MDKVASNDHYDVLVLGGGSAGSSAASAAAAAGARTGMINDGELGGLCILRGCMPTKSMLAAAHAIHEARHLGRFGARLEGKVVPDFQAIMKRKAGHVARFKQAKVDSVLASDYEVIDARGRFAPGGGIIAGSRTLSADAYVIATGSDAVILDIPGIGDVPVLTSDDVMRLETQPRKLLVQGAGPIGLELAQFFARIGTEVTLINRSPLLSRSDPESGEELTRALTKEDDFNLFVPGVIEQLTPSGSGLRASIRSGDQLHDVEADALLMAAGRRAALDDLGLEHVGIPLNRGRISHDAQMRTDAANVFVAGDATGTYQILHLANSEGRVAGANAARVALGHAPDAGSAPETMDYRLSVSVIFTDPPYAIAGANESTLKKEGRDFIVAQARFPETGRAITMETEHGLWKILADPKTGEILGSSILGPRADDLIHLISTLMHYRGTVDDILALPWYHPTLSEVIINLGRGLKRQLQA